MSASIVSPQAASDPPVFAELKAGGQLPSPSAVAMRLLELASRDDVGVAELARVLAADPALTGRILQAANAAIHGGRPVVVVADAVARLGLRSVRQLALAFSLLERNRRGPCAAFDYEAYWSGSLATAVAAQRLARETRVAQPDECFTVGLLHDIGALALASVFPSEYACLLADHGAAPEFERAAAERRLFGIAHEELSAAMMDDWGLPAVFVEAVRHRRDPGALPAGSRAMRLAETLACAGLLGDACVAGARTADAERRELERALGGLGLDSPARDAVMADASREWGEWGSVLGIDTSAAVRRAPASESRAREPAPVAEPPRARRVLVVDDSESQLLVLCKLVRSCGFEPIAARDGVRALELVRTARPDIIVTDWVMPELDGIGLCRAVRVAEAARAIYVILLTAHGDRDKLVTAFEAGADDFLSKPVDARELQARLRAARRVVELQDALLCEAEKLRQANVDLAAANGQLADSAFTDSLTALPNRRRAIERLIQEWSAYKRKRTPLAVVMLDIDNFKKINDCHGHAGGDLVLERIGCLLRQEMRVEDTVARFGGEEFLVMVPDLGLAAARRIAERLRHLVEAQRFTAAGRSWRVTASFGVAEAKPEHADWQALLREADAALYRAKNAGRNRVTVTA